MAYVLLVVFFCRLIRYLLYTPETPSYQKAGGRGGDMVAMELGSAVAVCCLGVV